MKKIIIFSLLFSFYHIQLKVAARFENNSEWPVDSSPATLPQVVTPTTYSVPIGCTEIAFDTTPTGGCKEIQVTASNQFQTALNNIRRGDIIELACSTSYTGTFIIQSQSDIGWSFIQPSEDCVSDLPSTGTRIIPNDLTGTPDESDGLYVGAPAANFNAAVMPKIIGSGSPHVAFFFEDGADSYVIRGIQITNTAGTSGLVRVIYEGWNGTDPVDIENIIFDQIYIPGVQGGIDNTRAFMIQSNKVAIINSYCNNWLDTDSDSQCILILNPVEGCAILNNYLEASGENVFWDSAISTRPSDCHMRWNYVRKALDWRTGGGGNVKNLVEMKSAQRILIEGNLFCDSWGDTSQETSMNIKIGDEDPDKLTSNITIRKNYFCRVGNAVKLCVTSCNAVGLLSTHQIFYNNIMEVSGALYGRGTTQDGYCYYNAIGGGDDSDITIIVSNNTCLNDGPGAVNVSGDGGTPNGTGAFVNNIHQVAVSSPNHFTTADADTLWADGYSYVCNLQVNGSGGSYPANNFTPASWTAVGFVNYNNGVGGDYTLDSGAAQKGACTDTYSVGTTDPGANVPVVMNAISRVLVGNSNSWTPLSPAPLFVLKPYGTN